MTGCPVRGLHPEAILLEDIERCFDGDFSLTSNCTLKICLTAKPCSGCVSLLSSWVKADKVAGVQVYFVRDACSDDSPPERPGLSFKAISHEKLRNLLGDVDWTALIQQQQRPSTALTESVCDGGTFTLDPDTPLAPSSNGDLKQRPMSASVCSSGSRSSFNSRIPMPKASTVMSGSNVSHTFEDEEDLAEANQRLRSLVQRLTSTLTTILDVDVALRNNLMSMHELVTEVQEEVGLR